MTERENTRICQHLSLRNVNLSPQCTKSGNSNVCVIKCKFLQTSFVQPVQAPWRTAQRRNLLHFEGGKDHHRKLATSQQHLSAALFAELRAASPKQQSGPTNIARSQHQQWRPGRACTNTNHWIYPWGRPLANPARFTAFQSPSTLTLVDLTPRGTPNASAP